MEVYEFGKAFFLQSKIRLLHFLPLLLLMSALPHWELTLALMPTMWHALTGFFEAPAFAFLLLNCLIVTIIASSMLESDKRGHEEESKRESMREIERGDERGAVIAENVLGQSHKSSIKYAYDYMDEGTKLISTSSCSLDANYKNKINQEPINLNLNEKKPIRRARLTCRGSDKVRLHPNKPLIMSSLKEKKRMRSSFSFHDYEKPALEKNCDDIVDQQSIKRLGHAENYSIDHRPRQAVNSAAVVTAHPSLDEVWAAINERNDCKACMQAENPQPQPAAAPDAPSQPAAAAPAPPAASHTPPAAAAAVAANPLRGAKAGPNPSGAPSKACAAAIEKHIKDADDQENDSELEELNRRAEEFIARFNHQMRLQRQESLQGRQRECRPCNYDIQHPHHLQLPSRGLLVG